MHADDERSTYYRVSEDILPVEVLRKYKYMPRCDVFWRFVTGMLNAAELSANLIEEIEKEPLNLMGPTH